MAFFDRFRTKWPTRTLPPGTGGVLNASVSAQTVTDVTVAQKGTEQHVDGVDVKVGTSFAQVSSFVLRPWISEKVNAASQKGSYVFEVVSYAEKVSLRRVIEMMYGVKVESVRLMRVKGKPVHRGRRTSARRDRKKAIVTLQKGQSINLFSSKI